MVTVRLALSCDPLRQVCESEALAIALETGAQLLLMDELRGRKAAINHGIVPLGALGVLLRAKLDALEFYMSAELKTDVLRLAGE